jgi:carbon storage regulator
VIVLVVTRKRNEAIVIGDGIEVRVLRTGRDGVRLGISAPAHVAVHRREVYDLIRAVNASAADGSIEISGLVERLRGRAGGPKERIPGVAPHV